MGVQHSEPGTSPKKGSNDEISAESAEAEGKAEEEEDEKETEDEEEAEADEDDEAEDDDEEEEFDEEDVERTGEERDKAVELQGAGAASEDDNGVGHRGKIAR